MNRFVILQDVTFELKTYIDITFYAHTYVNFNFFCTAPTIKLHFCNQSALRISLLCVSFLFVLCNIAVWYTCSQNPH